MGTCQNVTHSGRMENGQECPSIFFSRDIRIVSSTHRRSPHDNPTKTVHGEGGAIKTCVRM